MIKRFTILIFIGIFSLSVYAQKNKQPKIGLALSGGGAKGMAHVGLLKVLEEVGIVPDYITGVSMGSIVGGLYASGYSADSIEKIMKAQDWNQILSDKIYESDIFFDEKEIFRNELMNLSFDNKQINAPGGFIQGQRITEMMNYYTFSVSDIQDFDSLAIPYLAVATDIQSCKAVVLNKGNLSDVMRASMAFPLVFAPAEIDTLLLVDGAVVRNFAVEELKKMGADIIIGCNVGGGLYKKNQLTSMTSIAEQVASFVGVYDSKKQDSLVDVLIKPKFGNLSARSFDEVNQLINIGYKESQNYIDTLKKISKLIKPHTIKHINNLNSVVVDTILIVGNKNISDKQIRKIIGLKKGASINKDIIQKKIAKLYGMFFFDKVSYKLQKSDNKYALIISCKEKKKHNINVFLHFDTYSDFSVNLSYLNRNFLLQKSRLLVQTSLSNNLKFKADYTLYFGNNSSFSTKLGTYFAKSDIPSLFLDQDVRSYKHFDFNLFTSANYTITYNQNLGLQFDFDRGAISSNINLTNRIQRLQYDNLAVNLTYQLNTLDRYYFPTNGFDINCQIKSGLPLYYKYDYDNDSLDVMFYDKDLTPFHQVILKSRYFITLKNITLGATANGVLSTQNKFINNYMLFGGVGILNRKSIPFLGFHANEFVVQNAFGGGLSVKYNLQHNIQLGLHFESYFIEDLNKVKLKNYKGLAFDIGYNTKIGPINFFIMEGLYPDTGYFSNLKFYLNIGFLL